jgi:hypothetical protein
MKILTSDSPLKETVLGVFDLAEIVAGGSTAAQKPKKKSKFRLPPLSFLGISLKLQKLGDCGFYQST